MSEKEHDIGSLSDSQIVDLLNLARPPASERQRILEEYRRLVLSSSADLRVTALDRMSENNLNDEDAARLLGVAGLTLKRWIEEPSSLSAKAKAKLAGLLILLSFREDSAFEPRATGLVNSAIVALRGQQGEMETPSDEDECGVVESVFGVSGVMAAALYASIAPGVPRCSSGDAA